MSTEPMQVNEASASYLAAAKALDVPRGYKRTEVGVIPEDWGYGRLADVTTRVGSGITPTGGERVYSREGRPFLRSQNVGWGKLVLNDLAFISDEIHATFPASEIKEGDILLNITGASIGRSAVADARIASGNVNQHVCEIRTDWKKLDPKFLNSYLIAAPGQRQIDSFQAGGNRQGLNYNQIRSFLVPLPPIHEQHAIAKALSDVDGLIAALDKLIAKKRAVKQAAMQRLLTGKTRLPGFSGKWETRQLGELIELIPSGIYGVEKQAGSLTGMPVATTAHINANDSWNDKEMDVRYFIEGQLARYLPREGDLIVVKSSGSAASIQSGKVGFVTRERAGTFIFSNFLMLLRPVSCGARFLYFHLISDRVKRMLPQLVEASTYPNIRINDYLEIAIPFPEKEEQSAIAGVLSDMDAEITMFEARCDKTKQIKQGMMQQLLTGRVRLVKLEGTPVAAETTKQDGRKHNKQINEAVIVSVLAKQFGTERYPLGRKRYTKLSYLFHRHAEGQVEGYLKKAAGPYNPGTKYGGPEKIALKNGYLREHGSGPYRGFVASTNIAQAEGYFEKWYGSEPREWLEQFRYKSNDELELLATVDMAIEESRAEKKGVNVQDVKHVISSHPEWKAKLERSIFSDANIAEAIETCRILFG